MVTNQPNEWMFQCQYVVGYGGRAVRSAQNFYCITKTQSSVDGRLYPTLFYVVCGNRVTVIE